jgi:hypothetical protein
MASFLLYGDTRSGKTRLMLTLAEEGPMVVCDSEGQVAAECPSAFTVTLPPIPPKDAGADALKERNAKRDAILAEAITQPIVIWPIRRTADYDAFKAAMNAERLGERKTVCLDSYTYLLKKLIDEICGVSIVHKRKDGQDIEAIDPVYNALPDFTGTGVQRTMETKDWDRVLHLGASILSAAKDLTEPFGRHLVFTALAEKRDIFDGEGPNKRFLRTAQGPLFAGRALGTVIPPLFNYVFRCVTEEENGRRTYKVQTAPHQGWPAGVRGKASQIWSTYELNPNLSALLKRLG